MERGLPPQGVFYLEHNIISSEHADDDHMNDDHGDWDKRYVGNVPPNYEVWHFDVGVDSRMARLIMRMMRIEMMMKMMLVKTMELEVEKVLPIFSRCSLQMRKKATIVWHHAVLKF